LSRGTGVALLHAPTHRILEQQMTNQQMAQTLGYTSLALGVAEIAAPGFLSSQLGIENRPKLLGALAARKSDRKAGVAVATAMVLGITGLDIMCAMRATRRDALAA
jgi:hypothetical protein